MINRFKLKNDKFRKARGGYSRILEISCANCKSHICFYQKDGPGIIKRIYLDRIFDMENFDNNLVCNNCRSKIGVRDVYEKENRPVYRISAGSISKRLIPR